MPFALVAGIVTKPPKTEPFPVTGRPRCEIVIRCDSQVGELYRVVGFDDRIAELEILRQGDAVAIQGAVDGKKGRQDRADRVFRRRAANLHIGAQEREQVASRDAAGSAGPELLRVVLCVAYLRHRGKLLRHEFSKVVKFLGSEQFWVAVAKLG